MAKYYYIVGIRVGFLIVAIINLFNTYIQVNFTSLFMIYFVMILYGVVL